MGWPLCCLNTYPPYLTLSSASGLSLYCMVLFLGSGPGPCGSCSTKAARTCPLGTSGPLLCSRRAPLFLCALFAAFCWTTGSRPPSSQIGNLASAAGVDALTPSLSSRLCLTIAAMCSGRGCSSALLTSRRLSTVWTMEYWFVSCCQWG